MFGEENEEKSESDVTESEEEEEEEPPVKVSQGNYNSEQGNKQ